MVNRGSNSDRFEYYGVIIVAPLIVLKKFAKEPAVHFSIVVTGMFFLNYVADLEAVDRVVVNEVQPTYLTYQSKEVLPEDITSQLRLQND